MVVFISAESSSSSSSLTSRRVFPAVQYLGCEALTVMLAQCADTTATFTIG